MQIETLFSTDNTFANENATQLIWDARNRIVQKMCVNIQYYYYCGRVVLIDQPFAMFANVFHSLRLSEQHDRRSVC